MGKKKKTYMAVFDAFDWLSINENTKNWGPFERSPKVLQIYHLGHKYTDSWRISLSTV